MSIANIRQFNTWIDRQARIEIPEAGIDLSKNASRLALIKIVEKTPVLTGAALANWKVSINAPDTAKVPYTDKTGAVTISRAENDLALALLGDTIFIQNNLEYIEALENGHSQKAPFGMVQVSLAELQALGIT